MTTPNLVSPTRPIAWVMIPALFPCFVSAATVTIQLSIAVPR